MTSNYIIANEHSLDYFCFLELKKFIAYSLLVSFVVLLTPRGMWHHHHDDHEHANLELHDHHDSDSENVHEDCFQCDYDLDVAEQALSYKYRFGQKNNYKHPEIVNYFVSQQKLDFDNLRGPPNA